MRGKFVAPHQDPIRQMHDMPHQGPGDARSNFNIDPEAYKRMRGQGEQASERHPKPSANKEHDTHPAGRAINRKGRP